MTTKRGGKGRTRPAVSMPRTAPRDGLTKSGILHWLVGRYQFGGVPFLGTGLKLPDVDLAEEGIGRL